MAERRMFAKTIIDSDAFLDMPLSTQALYFHLSMRADDDGFINNPKNIRRMIGCSEDDMKLLAVKKFIIPFASGVVVIKHWKIHNYIQKDRYTKTKYKDEKSMLLLDDNNSYSLEEGVPIEESKNTPKTSKKLTPARQKRLEAKQESDLPYSFSYKIRNAFIGEKCPICNCTMSNENNLVKPTIQHNIPISKGGKHEIDNISVICASCNTSIQNRNITEPYNTELVKKVWECIGNGTGMDTQVRLGKDSIGKDSIDKVNSSSDEKYKEIYNLYEQLGFGTINIASISDIDMLIEENTFEYVKNAMLEANRKGIRRLDYVMGILKDWKVNGMKTSIDKYKTEPKEENKNNRLEEFNKRLAEMQKKKKKVD